MSKKNKDQEAMFQGMKDAIKNTMSGFGVDFKFDNEDQIDSRKCEPGIRLTVGQIKEIAKNKGWVYADVNDYEKGKSFDIFKASLCENGIMLDLGSFGLMLENEYFSDDDNDEFYYEDEYIEVCLFEVNPKMKKARKAGPKNKTNKKQSRR